VIFDPRRFVRRWQRVDWLRWGLGLFTALFLVFVALPILVVVAVSFSEDAFITFPIRGWSLKWYQRMYEYAPFMNGLLVSLQLAAASAIVGALLGVPAALAVARSRNKGIQALSVLLLSPISIPAIVLGFSLLYFLSALSMGIGFPALLIAHSVVAIPYISRTVLSVYRSLPPNFEESAIMLGASRASTLWHVTLPLLRPGIFAGMLFAVLISLDNLPLSLFFASAQTNTLPVIMLSFLQNQFDPSVAAIATVQMLLAVGALFAADRVFGIGRISPV